MDKNQFKFSKSGYGCYFVTYTNVKRGDYYISMITDMTLIDNVNEEFPKKKHLKELANSVKRNGMHYNKYGEYIADKYNC